MTTLRDIFKKSKTGVDKVISEFEKTKNEINENFPKFKEELKTKTKETANNILDADLQNVAKKTSLTLWKMILTGFAIFIVIFIIYFFYAVNRCEYLYNDIMLNTEKLTKISKQKAIDYKHEFSDFNCNLFFQENTDYGEYLLDQKIFD